MAYQKLYIWPIAAMMLKVVIQLECQDSEEEDTYEGRSFDDTEVFTESVRGQDIRECGRGFVEYHYCN